MNLIKKMEKKFSKYAIRNLGLYIIILYVIGYVIQFAFPAVQVFLYLNPYLIMKGQVWRLVTWLLIPPYAYDSSSIFNIFWVLIMLYFYYSISRTLENVWGTFYFNLYLFMGYVFTLLGAVLIYVVVFATGNIFSYNNGIYLSMFFTTYYVNMSIFLGFATTFPNERVLLFFFIPLKVKWLGFAYGALLLWDTVSYMIRGAWPLALVILFSLLNYLIFFFIIRKNVRGRARHTKATAKTNTVHKQMRVTRHKCAVCGRTEETNPELIFRFCSKCNGNYEYCNDHIFTHTHIR